MNDMKGAFKKGEEKRQARRNNEPEKASKVSELPDTSLLESERLSDEDWAQIWAESQRKRELAETAGPRLFYMKLDLQRMEAIIVSGGILPQKIQKTYDSDRNRLEEFYKSLDPEMRKRVDFSEFLESIRHARSEIEGNAAIRFDDAMQRIQQIMLQACEMGRYRSASKEDISQMRSGIKPAGTIFIQQRVYLPCSNGAKTLAQKGLETELFRLLKVCSCIRRSAEEETVSKLRKAGKKDLTGLRTGDQGKYVLDFPDRQDGQRHYPASVGLVQVFLQKPKQKGEGEEENQGFPALLVKAGTGTLRWMSNPENQDKWIPLSWCFLGIPEGKVIGKHLAVFADKLIKVVRAAEALSKRSR